MKISWTELGTLQAADSPVDPWHDVVNASNPMTVTQEGQQFYRLRP